MGDIKDVFDVIKNLFLSLTVNDRKLISFCRKNDIKGVRSQLEGGANVNAWEEKNRTVLIEASANGQDDLVGVLISFKADVNHRDDNGRTALMEASMNAIVEESLDGRIVKTISKKHLKVVKALLRAGADVNLSDDNGNTALIEASRNGDLAFRIIDALIGAGADVNLSDNNGYTALIEASRAVNSSYVIDVLIKAGADINAKTHENIWSRDYTTARLEAIKHSKPHYALALLKNGADPFLGNRRGERPIDFAKRNNTFDGTEALKILQEAEKLKEK